LAGQIRFLSQYFLNKPNEQILEHGADLYAGYLQDKDFVENVEKNHRSPDLLLGNNDRHFYNWGIIRNINTNELPRFSPIYDTARGLYWNDHEEKINAILMSKSRLISAIGRYSNQSKPKTGWEGVKNMNHFQLIEKLCTLEITQNCQTIKDLCSNIKLDNVFNMIDAEFSLLLSPQRRELIKMTLKYRFDIIQKMITFVP